MPKQTETLSVFLPTRSDEEDSPLKCLCDWTTSSQALLLSCPGNVFGTCLSPCNLLLFSYSLKHSRDLSGTNKGSSLSSGGPATTTDSPISCLSFCCRYRPSSQDSTLPLSQQHCYLTIPTHAKRCN